MAHAAKGPPMDVEVVLENRHLTWHMYRSLVGIAMICATIIVSVYILTGPIIQQNKAEALEKAILKVLPKTATRQGYGVDENGQFVKISDQDGATIQLYAGYDKQKRLIGFAIAAKGMGYQDTIEMLYGYSPYKKSIIGINILASRETPGLGDKIRNDPGFLANFRQLDVSLNLGKSALKNPITVVKKGKKSQPWQIDSITGATVSSKAIGNILQKSATKWVPAIRQNREEFDIGVKTRDD